MTIWSKMYLFHVHLTHLIYTYCTIGYHWTLSSIVVLCFYCFMLLCNIYIQKPLYTKQCLFQWFDYIYLYIELTLTSELPEIDLVSLDKRCFTCITKHSPTCVYSTAAEKQIDASPPDGKKKLEMFHKQQKCHKNVPRNCFYKRLKNMLHTRCNLSS